MVLFDLVVSDVMMLNFDGFGFVCVLWFEVCMCLIFVILVLVCVG